MALYFLLCQSAVQNTRKSNARCSTILHQKPKSIQSGKPPLPRSFSSMDQNPRSAGVLDSLGEEIIRIIAPVSACMFMVVLLVSVLNSSSSSSSPYVSTIATMAYAETSSDSSWDKFTGAFLNSLVFVAVVTVVTFILVLLFYLRCTRFLKLYMGFSAFVVLGFMGGEIALFLIGDFNFPLDCITFFVVLYNFAAVGVAAVFMSKMAIFVTQAYLVVIGMLVAYWFTLLPEWTTWMLLVAMALYDLAAVLLPGGPLRLLVELAISRDEDIPALVYEARPLTSHSSGPNGRVVQRRVWRRRGIESGLGENVDSNSGFDSESGARSVLASNSTAGTISVGSEQHDTGLLIAEEGRVTGRDSELSAPLMDSRMIVVQHGQEEPVSGENLVLEGIGLGSSGAIKLGLGDFIFYSVLVGRAAMYDLMTVYACYLAIIAGLGITLLLLAFYQKALPALPVSVMLGVLFYFLTRILLEVFVVQCSMNLLLF
ncbi:presenilin-like protein At2g29900 [Malania oleifera]|uniref:presenilin-like protein At2g29900 n=1 Tax=Malania oleifera TaxID=397392 RepID=UPI0025AEC1A3|nr:presenilin-like protein At2g29900 [Malania oleifera]